MGKIKFLPFLHYYIFAVWIPQYCPVKHLVLYVKRSLFIVLTSRCNIRLSHILCFTVSLARLL